MQSGGLPAAFSAFNMFYRPALLALYDHGGSLSSADAKCRKSGMSASFLHLIHQGDQDPAS